MSEGKVVGPLGTDGSADSDSECGSVSFDTTTVCVDTGPDTPVDAVRMVEMVREREGTPTKRCVALSVKKERGRKRISHAPWMSEVRYDELLTTKLGCATVDAEL
jgi:hypothetical protein